MSKLTDDLLDCWEFADKLKEQNAELVAALRNAENLLNRYQKGDPDYLPADMDKTEKEVLSQIKDALAKVED
jgi:hypothetical protein